MKSKDTDIVCHLYCRHVKSTLITYFMAHRILKHLKQTVGTCRNEIECAQDTRAK